MGRYPVSPDRTTNACVEQQNHYNVRTLRNISWLADIDPTWKAGKTSSVKLLCCCKCKVNIEHFCFLLFFLFLNSHLWYASKEIFADVFRSVLLLYNNNYNFFVLFRFEFYVRNSFTKRFHQKVNVSTTKTKKERERGKQICKFFFDLFQIR